MIENLREKVVRWLRAEIISGHMPARSMLSVPGLASTLNVSSTPVREALLELTRKGLLRPHRNRGFEVVEPSSEEISRIFELRELLEIESAKLALERGPVDTAKLKGLAVSIEASANAGDYRTYIEADREFHREIARGAHSQILLEYITDLKDRIRLYGLTTAEGKKQQLLSIDEHFQIVELVKNRKSYELQMLLKRHIRVWEPIYLSSLEGMRSALVL
ncbi:GntR family transcriptional regulator [Tianweitania sp.]|uniref:GntR family transcriptional regulator n=1 Tax=Tianweitania sp. TaxID=2021634 RepID=UPI0028975A79|nr:GntR family transcriptional regulator [Tianweitania sp.]